MKRILWYGLFTALLTVGFASLHGTAQAAPSCSMDQSSLLDLIYDYDPITATSATTITVPNGALKFTCSGLGGNPSNHVHVFVSGSNNFPTYATPAFTSYQGYTLTYTLCAPGITTCTASTAWNTTQNDNVSNYEVSALNGDNTIPSFLIFLGKQDAYVGTTSNYTGNLYFSFKCGQGGSEVNC